MPLSPSATRELLTKLDHTPRHFLGQNFLVDGNIVNKSVELAEVTANDVVIEVGPGLGTLTAALLATGAEVWAIEKDRTLHAYLTETLSLEYPDRFHLTEGDAVSDSLASLPAGNTEHKIVANLPYAISTPWMDKVLSGPLPSRMVLMLQREAADRYAAQPGGKQMGAISVFLQSAYEIAPGHKVSPHCFYPRPDVGSYLLHLVRRPSPRLFHRAAKQLIRDCFQRRRKQLGSLLRGKLADDGQHWFEKLEAAGLSPQSRPEQVPIALWGELTVPEAVS